MDPLHLFLLDQGFPVEYELDKFNTSHTGTTLRHPQNWLCRLRCRNSAPTPSDFTSGQHFLETFPLLPETTRNTNSQWLQRFSPQTANTTFAKPCRTYLPLMSNNTHCFLNYHNFKSFTYFFPSYKTCSINVNSSFYVAIKNLHVKANGIFIRENQEENKLLYPDCKLIIQGSITLSFWNRNHNHSV